MTYTAMRHASLSRRPAAVAPRAQVRRVLSSGPVDSIIEQVPYLMDPHALAQSLSNVSRW